MLRRKRKGARLEDVRSAKAGGAIVAEPERRALEAHLDPVPALPEPPSDGVVRRVRGGLDRVVGRRELERGDEGVDVRLKEEEERQVAGGDAGGGGGDGEGDGARRGFPWQAQINSAAHKA